MFFTPCRSSRLTRALPVGIAACAVIALLVALHPLPVAAQDIPNGAPPHLRVVDGELMLERADGVVPGDPGMPLVGGDRLRTNRGRAEVLFADGTLLDIDEFSSIDLQSPFLLRLFAGRVRLTIPRDAAGSRFQVDMAAASAVLQGPGDYRVSVLGSSNYPQSELSVIRGNAQLLADRGSVRLESGERSIAWPNDVPSRPERLSAARTDAFDQWAESLRDDRPSAVSGQYLPPDLRVYGSTLDRSGTWEYDAPYGYVWYPTVDATWHPYYDGYWAPLPVYGWTWIGSERWAYPTHHYGRWGYAHSRWFWIPDRHWGPAWVSWGAAPGYVSWCPLGFDNRPVFQMSFATGGWAGGWVVLPRDHFGGRGEHVRHYAVTPRALPPRTPFVVQSGPPTAPGRTPVTRIGGEPAHGGGALPRAGASTSTPAQAPPVGRRPLPPRPGGDRGAPPAAGSAGRSAPDASTSQPRYRVPGAAAPPNAPRGPGDQPATAGTAIPRGSAATTGDTAPGSVPSAGQPRRYPFGDFRRPGLDAPAPAQDSAPAGRPGTAVPRPGTPAPDAAAAPAPQHRAEPEVIVPPPPAAAGGRASRGDAATGRGESNAGAVGSSPRAGAGGAVTAPRSGPQGGGSAHTGAPESGGNRGTGRQAPQQQGQSGGRTHAPESRRPR